MGLPALAWILGTASAAKWHEVPVGLDRFRGGILAPTRMSRRNFQMSGKVRLWKMSILVGILAALTLAAGQSYGQSQAITAALSGTVHDPSGQTVSGAKITLESPERGISRTYVTTDNGLYSFTLLPPAIYRLQVEAAGFKHYRQDGIELIPGQSAEQKVGLIVGAISENIEVTSQAPLLNAENANISSDISARQVVELP